MNELIKIKKCSICGVYLNEFGCEVPGVFAINSNIFAIEEEDCEQCKESEDYLFNMMSVFKPDQLKI